MIKLERPLCPNPEALKNANHKHEKNKQALVNASYGKCMYCETHVTADSFGDVEHIKPKKLFPLLEFIWENLGFACARCNNAKRNKYHKNLPYIDPYSENPDEFFIAAGPMIFPKKGNQRASVTITDLKLQRDSLIEKRKEKINIIQKIIELDGAQSNSSLKQKALNDILHYYNEKHEYSFFIKALLEAHGYKEP